MKHEMRRKDRQLDEAQTLKILVDGEFGVLSMLDVDGNAYGVPLSYAWHEGAIYLHCATEGMKLDAVKAHPSVSFCVVGKTQVLPEKFSTGYESVIVFGECHVLSGEDKVTGLMALVGKYSPGFEEKGLAYAKAALEKTDVLRITVTSFTGKGRPSV